MKQFVKQNALFLANLFSITYGSVVLGIHFHSAWVGGAVWNIAFALLPRLRRSITPTAIILELKGGKRNGIQDTTYTSPKSVC